MIRQSVITRLRTRRMARLCTVWLNMSCLNTLKAGSDGSSVNFPVATGKEVKCPEHFFFFFYKTSVICELAIDKSILVFITLVVKLGFKLFCMCKSPLFFCVSLLIASTVLILLILVVNTVSWSHFSCDESQECTVFISPVLNSVSVCAEQKRPVFFSPPFAV